MKSHEMKLVIMNYIMSELDHPKMSVYRLALRDLLYKAADHIEEQENVITRMKCCGNCDNSKEIINELKCFEGLPRDEWRYSKRAKPTSADGRCDKWVTIA